MIKEISINFNKETLEFTSPNMHSLLVKIADVRGFKVDMDSILAHVPYKMREYNNTIMLPNNSKKKPRLDLD
jgi:hypothetical protein